MVGYIGSILSFDVDSKGFPMGPCYRPVLQSGGSVLSAIIFDVVPIQQMRISSSLVYMRGADGMD